MNIVRFATSLFRLGTLPRILTTAFFTVLFTVFFIVTLPFQPVFAAKQMGNENVTATIAVVNVRHLLQHAPQSEEATKALKKRFSNKELKLDEESEAIRKFEEAIRQAEGQQSRSEKIEKERELRSRKRTQNRALEDYREELRIAKNSALDEVQKAVFEAIDVVRERQKIDIVIQDFVSASERVDITKDVLAYLADKLKEEQASKKDDS